MGGQNTYLTYKRETAELLYWVIQAFSSIVQKTGAEDEDGLSLRNTTGKTTVQGLVSMRLGADPEVKKSNASHKHFIDALKEALKLLGGESGPAKKNVNADPSHEAAPSVESNIILLANKFASLYLGTAGDAAHDDDEVVSDASDSPDVVVAAKKAQTKSSGKGKGKKGKRGKKLKQEQAKAAAKEPGIADVPIESYRIIEDQEGIVTDYLMATYALAEEWVQLRNYMQKTWRKVAYNGLNSAVAGTLGNVAVSMLKRSELAMYVDFPVESQPSQCWDPNFDLQRATPEQRLKWRRSYTLNWLYDLVNVFSAIVVQRNTLKGQNWALEKVDWSVHGPWNMHRRLFGLNEFAGLVTSLAMQKQGTDVRNKIQPHLVTFKGHIMQPLARQFRPRRDVDLFLDREQERTGRGFLQAVHVVEQLFERDAMMNGNPNRHTEHMEIVKIAQDDIRDWLGESKYMYGLNTIPPSRFSKTNTNGLWEYSPYLCGVGLMEGLELSYLLGMMVWDRTPEPFLLIHLHNMLVKKGYIAQPLGLYLTLQEVFARGFFVDGKAPTSNFQEALVARINEFSGRAKAAHRATRRSMAQSNDIHGMLDVKGNGFY
ncbi:hypothetical protein LQW54_000734 [Pestalotiopsis sp. IQ-011]